MNNTKCFRLLMKLGKGGEFEYVDFIRTKIPISEEKNEIRRNIEQYGMDKQVIKLVREVFEENHGKKQFNPLLYLTKSFCVVVDWDEESKKVTRINIGFYE
mgnify:CR=1 FL=1